ncbi:MAG: hypothetical protein AB7N91_02815 [Candidatus Tectimicrobiota bacterium]
MPSLLHLGILWLHLLAVGVWLGGLVFQAWVVAPTWSRTPNGDGLRFVLSLEARFRVVLWPAIGLALFTGLVNLVHTWHALGTVGVHVSVAFQWILGIKVGLITVMLLLQMLQQLVLRPRRLAALQEAVARAGAVSERTRRLQRVSALLARLAVLLGAIVMACGVLLRAV